jgi:hypothetical protein
VANLGTGGPEQLVAVRGVVPSREDVATDVRKVVGGCRSRGDFQRLDTPALDQLLALRKLTHDDGPDLLARGIAAVEPARYRQFLEILLPMPFDEGERWPSLGPSRRGPGRGDLAAAVFGLDTWDGCTRPSITLDDRSRRDWAELHLATALIQVAAGDQEASAVPDVPDPLPVESRWQPRISILVAAAAGLIVVALIAAFFIDRADGSDDPSESAGRRAPTALAPTSVPEGVLSEQCISTGTLDAEVGARPDAGVWTSTLRSIYAHAEETAPLGCAIKPAYAWEGMVVQELDSGEAHLPAAIVASEPAIGIVLNGAQWGAYKRIGSGDGTLVEEVAGPPLRTVARPDGAVEVESENGVVMVAETADSPYFWIFGPYVAWWKAHPELGLPTENPLPTLSQDLQHGRAEVPRSGGQPQAVLDPHPESDLPPPSERRGHILRQADGTTWWIDRFDRRHWIATGEVWTCLGGEEAEYPTDVPGHAIATLPLARHAKCPD